MVNIFCFSSCIFSWHVCILYIFRKNLHTLFVSLSLYISSAVMCERGGARARTLAMPLCAVCLCCTHLLRIQYQFTAVRRWVGTFSMLIWRKIVRNVKVARAKKCGIMKTKQIHRRQTAECYLCVCEVSLESFVKYRDVKKDRWRKRSSSKKRHTFIYFRFYSDI